MRMRIYGTLTRFAAMLITELASGTPLLGHIDALNPSSCQTNQSKGSGESLFAKP